MLIIAKLNLVVSRCGCWSWFTYRLQWYVCSCNKTNILLLLLIIKNHMVH